MTDYRSVILRSSHPGICRPSETTQFRRWCCTGKIPPASGSANEAIKGFLKIKDIFWGLYFFAGSTLGSPPNILGSEKCISPSRYLVSHSNVTEVNDWASALEVHG